MFFPAVNIQESVKYCWNKNVKFTLIVQKHFVFKTLWFKNAMFKQGICLHTATSSLINDTGALRFDEWVFEEWVVADEKNLYKYLELMRYGIEPKKPSELELWTTENYYSSCILHFFNILVLNYYILQFRNPTLPPIQSTLPSDSKNWKS